MLGHLRAFLFVEFSSLTHPSPLDRFFYFVTGFGHQAVIVFFVLSGYFVGGSVLNAFRQNRFSWNTYATSRLSRLWSVLIPALVWTWLLDRMGQRLNSDAYLGFLRDHFHSGPSVEHPLSLSPATFVSNLLFLQGITSPEFGTNGPLWSLTNEFWYYVLFPLGLHASGLIFRKPQGSLSKKGALTQLAIFGILVWVLPAGLTQAGFVWLLGAAVWWLSNPGPSSPLYLVVHRFNQSWIARGFFLVALAVVLTGARFGKPWGGDFALGVVFALCMLSWNGASLKTLWLRELFKWISEISYSLYLFHFPFLFFICAGMLGGSQWHPGLNAYLIFTGLALLTLVIGILAWLLFERHTPAARRLIERILNRGIAEKRTGP